MSMKFVVSSSLITLYYYLKISYSRFITLNTEPKVNMKFHKNKPIKSIRASILPSIYLRGITTSTINFSQCLKNASPTVSRGTPDDELQNPAWETLKYTLYLPSYYRRREINQKTERHFLTCLSRFIIR